MPKWFSDVIKILDTNKLVKHNREVVGNLWVRNSSCRGCKLDGDGNNEYDDDDYDNGCSDLQCRISAACTCLFFAALYALRRNVSQFRSLPEKRSAVTDV